MVSRVIPVEPFDLVIFGGTGDLARRKILPGLYRRFCAGQMPEGARVIGAARSEMDSAGYRDVVRAAIAEFAADAGSDHLDRFLDALEYVAIDARGEAGWAALAELMRGDVVRAFYFSVGPSLFGDLAERLDAHGLTDADSRIVVEKPFGHDLESARALNRDLATHFDETQILFFDLTLLLCCCYTIYRKLA
ncbi:MAG: glucose-6-phosphate dehydrogenase, partial [Pseudomonadota bacterium]